MWAQESGAAEYTARRAILWLHREGHSSSKASVLLRRRDLGRHPDSCSFIHHHFISFIQARLPRAIHELLAVGPAEAHPGVLWVSAPFHVHSGLSHVFLQHSPADSLLWEPWNTHLEADGYSWEYTGTLASPSHSTLTLLVRSIPVCLHTHTRIHLLETKVHRVWWLQ